MIIKVITHPNQKRQRVEKRENIFHVYVLAAPRDGLANHAVVDVLAEFFEVPRFEVELKTGHTSKIKIFEIHDA